jgi:hypothetical protein
MNTWETAEQRRAHPPRFGLKMAAQVHLAHVFKGLRIEFQTQAYLTYLFIIC